MTASNTFRELFSHSDWGRDKLLAAAEKLTGDQLDRSFEVGPGTLRETLLHLYGAERIWYERWHGTTFPEFPHTRAVSALSDLAVAWHHLAEARNGFIARLPDDPFDRMITYTNLRGETYTRSLGDLLLHLSNHGVHHRAQALYMLRHLGVKLKGLDPLYRRVELPTIDYSTDELSQIHALGFSVSERPSAPANLDPAVLRRCLAYGDWANEQLLDAAAELSEPQLDREWDIGLGRLRATLLHVAYTELWWYSNWMIGPRAEDEEPGRNMSVADLRRLSAEGSRKRDAYLAARSSADLLADVQAEVKPGVRLRFRLGESILQLVAHGTHHRAQALNMLRRLGAETPRLDYTDYLCQIGDSC